MSKPAATPIGECIFLLNIDVSILGDLFILIEAMFPNFKAFIAKECAVSGLILKRKGLKISNLI